MSFRLPDPIVDALLDKLGSDDGFRAAFVTDARGALASLGFEPAADSSITQGIWTCVSVDELASKEAIVAAHSALKAQLGAVRAAYNPISLTTGVRSKAA